MLGNFRAAETVRGIVQDAGGFCVVNSANPARGEPLEKGRSDGLQIRTARPGNDADSVKRGGCVHVGAILPQGFAGVHKILLIAFGAG